MAIEFIRDLSIGGSLDLTLHELLNAIIQKLGTAPTATEARLYYNSGDHFLYYHNGTGWIKLDAPVVITGKTDKVSGATADNFAGLDANGNLTDSGKKAADFLLASLLGAVNGVASLDASGKVPAGQLPSYVDDVVDVLAFTDTAPTEGLVADSKYYAPTAKKLYTYSGSAWNAGATPENDKIYICLTDSKSYRWSGSIMSEISSSLVIGTTSSTAAAGNRGLPPGGAVGQVLQKASANDYDGEWATPIKKVVVSNPSLTPTSDVATWTVTHNLDSQDVGVTIRRVSDQALVLAEVAATSTSAVTVKINASTAVTAGTYSATVIG